MVNESFSLAQVTDNLQYAGHSAQTSQVLLGLSEDIQRAGAKRRLALLNSHLTAHLAVGMEHFAFHKQKLYRNEKEISTPPGCCVGFYRLGCLGEGKLRLPYSSVGLRDFQKHCNPKLAFGSTILAITSAKNSNREATIWQTLKAVMDRERSSRLSAGQMCLADYRIP